MKGDYMYIKLCDRCGRVTENGPAFLLPSDREHGSYQVNGTWFGDKAVCLCNNCLDDFEKFRTEHEVFNHDGRLIHERDKNLEKYSIK